MSRATISDTRAALKALLGAHFDSAVSGLEFNRQDQRALLDGFLRKKYVRGRKGLYQLGREFSRYLPKAGA